METQDLIKKLKEPLDINDVDFRVQSISATGWATILAYKNARVDANRLDSVCGTNWQNDFKLIDGKMYGGVGIKIENEWVWRWDVGTESNQDSEKGQASDAFKRACFKWGIGRELYNYPLILVQLRQDEFKVENGKVKQTYALKIKGWVWSAVISDGEVKSLSAKDEKGVERFSYPRSSNQPQHQANQSAQQPENQQPEKPWLNVMSGKDFTKEWHNVLRGITTRAITSTDDVAKHYRLSKEVKAKLETEIANQNQTAA